MGHLTYSARGAYFHSDFANLRSFLTLDLYRLKRLGLDACSHSSLSLTELDFGDPSVLNYEKMYMHSFY